MRRNLNHLIIDNTIRKGHLTHETKQVGGNLIAIDGHRQIGLDGVGQVYHIDIYQREGFYAAVAHSQTVVCCFEILHGESTFLKVESHEAMQVFVYLILCQLTVPDFLLSQNVAHLSYFGMKVHPAFRVILDEEVTLCFLSDDEECENVRIFPAFKVAEIAFCQKLHIVCHLMVIVPLHEDVLFL